MRGALRGAVRRRWRPRRPGPRARQPQLRQYAAAESPWRVLQLEPGTDAKAVRSRYFELAIKAHPDHGGSDAEMQRLNLAYDQALEYLELGSLHRRAGISEPTDRAAMDHWAQAGMQATERNRQREAIAYYEDLPELMFIYRAGARPPAGELIGLQSGMHIAATSKAGPRFKECVVRLAEVRNGAVIGYAANRKEPCSTMDQKDWQVLRQDWGELKARGVWWGGPHGYLSHRVLLHYDDKLAAQNPGTTRSLRTAAGGGVHYDVDCTADKRRRTVDRGSGQLLWGYCGWAPGVLDKAVLRGAWRVLTVPTGWSDGRDAETMWREAMGLPYIRFGPSKKGSGPRQLLDA